LIFSRDRSLLGMSNSMCQVRIRPRTVFCVTQELLGVINNCRPVCTYFNTKRGSARGFESPPLLLVPGRESTFVEPRFVVQNHSEVPPHVQCPSLTHLLPTTPGVDPSHSTFGSPSLHGCFRCELGCLSRHRCTHSEQVLTVVRRLIVRCLSVLTAARRPNGCSKTY
jgi:hypothetical protein